MNVGLIGCGEIARTVISGASGVGAAVTAVLVRSEPRDRPDFLTFVRTVAELLDARPDVVVEVAGQNAVREYAVAVVSAGVDFLVLSSGAFAEDEFRHDVTRRASESGASVLIPSGAIAGIDGLLALRESGLMDVTYTSDKPPRSWAGTPAAAEVNLTNLTERTVFFSGSAREAARLYPANANIAATVAFAGVGLDRTVVTLAANPHLKGNAARLRARGRAGTLDVRVAGPPTATNPKSSLTTGFSVLAALRDHHACALTLS